MAYGRSTKYRVRRTRRPRRYRRSTTTFRKTSSRYRRKTRVMSKRRILNTTSTKKQDNMIPVATSATGTSPVTGSYTVFGNAGAMFVWCPTARDRNTGSDPTSITTREADICFIRGIKEAITMRTTSSGPSGAGAWLWRRIVFSAKGLYTSKGTSVDAAFLSAGYVRLLADQLTTPYGSVLTALIFKGGFGVDWNDTMTAKTDNTRVTIMYDKVTRLVPHNSSAQYWRFKRWHGVNKNLYYDNEEQGTVETVRPYSTVGKPGVGDIYIIDFFSAASQNSIDQLAFSAEATLYWHEK
ncbi:capsid protein [Capybara genomovirus 13]|nr:capsid protein [Capybara genomovirus 13]